MDRLLFRFGITAAAEGDTGRVQGSGEGRSKGFEWDGERGGRAQRASVGSRQSALATSSLKERRNHPWKLHTFCFLYFCFSFRVCATLMF